MAVLLRFIRNVIGELKGYSGCRHCGGTWDWKREHTILCTEDGRNGMFPLCEECYEKLSPQERYDYCVELWNSWGRPADEVNFDVIARSVGLRSSEMKETESNEL